MNRLVSSATGARLAATLLIALALAGCATSSTEGPDTGVSGNADADLSSQPLAFTGCQEILGAWIMTDEEVAPYVPSGFDPSPGTVSDATGIGAAFYLIGFVCSEPRDARVLFPWIPVVPPNDRANPDAFYHAISLPCLADAATAERLREWGAPCGPGDIAMERGVDMEGGSQWTMTAEGTNVTVRLAGNGVATDSPAGPELIPLFHSVGGTVCTVTDLLIGKHFHWEPGPFTADVEGTARFPVPQRPGDGLLAPHDFGITLTHVPSETPTETPSGCPA